MNRTYLLTLLFGWLLGTSGLYAQKWPSARLRVSILGDSYSTFQDHIPAGNAVWYHSPLDTASTDVARVQQTWWWQVVSEGGFLLEQNDSYSGATISYRGYRGEDYRDRSFITRLPRLGSPDILLIFGGTNDSWAGVPAGADSVPDLYTYRPALARLLAETHERFPNVAVCFMLNDGLRPDITQATIELCQRYNVPCLQLNGIDKKRGHPTVAGMRAIATQVLQFLADTVFDTRKAK